MTSNATLLEHLSVLLVSGPDARDFLQGQLSADLQALAPDRIVLASCNSPQGRVQAIVWLIERPDGLALLTSRSVAESIELRLRR
jgi:folate-binding Fe-S cluster repair protein YgfZ